MEKILISIVTYNSKDIFQTLETFQKEVLPYFPARIQIFDNASNKAYQEKLKTYESSQISLFFNQENKGFGYGHNLNFKNKKLEETIFIVCNPDILVSQKSFATLMETLTTSSEIVGMLTPKVLFPDGTTQHLVRKRLNLFDYMLRFQPFNFIKKIFQKRMAAFECQTLTDERQPILFGSGAFMVLKATTFEKVAGFDERFFMYFEDNDLCQKIRLKAQQEILYIPDAPIVHFYGKEAHRSYRVFKIFLKSMGQYFKKWGWQIF